jgi:multiple sugar transport system permease protein
MKTKPNSAPWLKGVIRTPYYVLTLGLAIIFLYPIIWAAISSVSPQPGSRQVQGYGLGNYRSLVHYQAGLGTYLSNSIVIAVLAVIITLALSTLAGYAFARFSFPGKNILFLLVLSILMVPYATLLIPLVIWLKAVHLNNTLVGVAIILAVFQLPFATFMMRISFESVPKEIEEAALMDGCGTFGALRRVLIHAVKPGIITVGIFAFLAAWNDFMVPLYLLSGENQPLP